MDFYHILEENGLSDLLNRVEYRTPQFTNLEKVIRYFTDIIRGNQEVFLVGDYDVDGLMCTMVLRNGLKMCGCTNIGYYRYRDRMHNLDPVAVQECIRGKYKYCIIADCGSNDVELLRQLLLYGVKVILLDHHETSYTYASYESLGDIIVINTTLETEGQCLSAGALCYCVMQAVLDLRNVYEAGLSVFALVSLYADCMSMHDRLNRSIYYKAVAVESSEIPNEIAMFMNQYQRITSRFINFWFSPRVNAMFRSNNLSVLNRLFIDDFRTAMETKECLSEIESGYIIIRDLVSQVADIVDVTELETIVVADLMSVHKHISVTENSLWNYTGLIANKLSERYSKAAFVYCRRGNKIQASTRDIYGRDFLSIFSQLCDAGGHSAAFGMQINIFDLDRMLYQLGQIDKTLVLTSVSNEPIVLPYKHLLPDMVLFEDIAQVNEFAGQDVPVILIKKQLVGDIREYRTEYNYKYRWSDCEIQSQHPVSFGSQMYLKPIKALKTKLLVQ